MRIAINGFGRIGRTAARIIFEKHHDIELVAVNDLTDNPTLAHLFKYDSNYGQFKGEVSADDDYLVISGQKIHSYSEKEPAKLPWDQLKVDVVLECTGRFTDPESAKGHLDAGAKQVIISAPPKGDIPTHVIGVNDDKIGDAQIISNASCTTNCIMPVAAIMHHHFKIKKAMMTTIHSYTGEQNLVDGPPPGGKKNDLRRARAAGTNIIPTSTGAAKSAGDVIPELKGIFDGMAIRVPTAVGSLSDFSMLVGKPTTVEEVNEVFREAAKQERYKGILEVTDDPIVSSDIIGNPASAIVDLGLTQVIDGDFVKVVAWYDNEYGYSSRLVELAKQIA